MQTKQLPILILLLSVGLMASRAIAQNHSVPWLTIAGGGGSSQSANYILRGTIGQWDAGRSSSSSLTLLGGFWAGSQAGTFAPGNLLVEVVDRPSGIPNYAQPVSIQELTTSGVLQQTKYMPTNYPRPTAPPFNLMEDAPQIVDGYLTRSADGRLVCVPGYNATNQELSISGSSTAEALRVVGVLSPDGTSDTSRAAGMFSSLNIYSVTSKDGSGFWAVGEGLPGQIGGLVYFQPSLVTNVLTNATFRCVRIVNNQLYVSPQGGLAGGVYAVGTGLPTNGTQRLTQLFPLTGDTYQFEINPSLTMAYVAHAYSAGIYGIEKFTNNGTTWSSSYILTPPGPPFIGVYGLAVDWGGPNPVVYATTVEATANRLVRVVDTGPSASGVTVRTAAAYTAFHGVTWTPVRLTQPVILSEQMRADGAFELTFTGTATQPYRVLASSDLAAPIANWTVVAGGMLDSGPATFIDIGAATRPLRFYRIASP